MGDEGWFDRRRRGSCEAGEIAQEVDGKKPNGFPMSQSPPLSTDGAWLAASRTSLEPPTSPSTLKRRVLLRGPGAMLLSALLFAVMSGLVKYAARAHVPAAETTFLRF